MVTPEVVATILKNADPIYKDNHYFNMGHSLIGKCKLGAVFVNQAGNYCVYTGISPSRKRPVAFTNAVTRQKMVGGMQLLEKIVKASQEMS